MSLLSPIFDCMNTLKSFGKYSLSNITYDVKNTGFSIKIKILKKNQ